MSPVALRFACQGVALARAWRVSNVSAKHTTTLAATLTNESSELDKLGAKWASGNKKRISHPLSVSRGVNSNIAIQHPAKVCPWRGAGLPLATRTGRFKNRQPPTIAAELAAIWVSFASSWSGTRCDRNAHRHMGSQTSNHIQHEPS